MEQDDFMLLFGAKSRLEAAEADHPDCPRLKRLHKRAVRLLYRFRDRLGLTDEQFAELAAPQGGGTPKTPPEED